MTTATTEARRPAPPRPRATRGRWRARWYRVAVPVLAAALLIGGTVAARMLEEPDLRAADTLAPAGTGPDGGSELARLLTAEGVHIDYVTSLEEAVAALGPLGDAVVFIPRPTVSGTRLANAAAVQSGQYRVVMVAPERRHLVLVPTGVRPTGGRWATTTAEPGCTVPEAVAAGTAAVVRQRYEGRDPSRVCYDGGLVADRIGYGASATELFVVGSADPFRNDRISEHGNAALAVGLLAAYDRVVWAGRLPLEIDVDLPSVPDPALPDLDPPPRRDYRSPTAGLAHLFQGYPDRVIAGLALAALVAALLALARARRMGGPVAEPLPVVVPAAEVVAGRGRLYRRARTRATALSALRADALRRIAPAVGLPHAPPPAPERVVAAVAARTGLPQEQVRELLYDWEPATDEELTQAAAALDALVARLTDQGGGA